VKNLIVLLKALLICFCSLVLFSDSSVDAAKIESKNSQINHGKKGEDGKYGEDGGDGEDGQNGGDGGNGGSGLLRGGNGGNGGNAIGSTVNPTSEQTNQDIDEMEYSILKDMCRQVISTSIAKFYHPLNEACLSHCRRIISTYLIQIGTAAARKIWQEYESIKWSYPAILTI
jgi:hypothetical protein